MVLFDNLRNLSLLFFEPTTRVLLFLCFADFDVYDFVQASTLCPSNFLKHCKQNCSLHLSQNALSWLLTIAGELHFGHGRNFKGLKSVHGLRTFAGLFGVFSKIDCAKFLVLFGIPIFS